MSDKKINYKSLPDCCKACINRYNKCINSIYCLNKTAFIKSQELNDEMA